MTTDPDDVITFRWEQLPVGQESAKNLKDEMESNKRSNQGTQAQRPQGGVGDSQEGGGGQSGGSSTNQGSDQSEMGLGPGDARSVIEEQEDLLNRLLDLLPYILMVLLALIALSLTYRYRARLWALVLLPFGLLMSVIPNLIGSTHGKGNRQIKNYNPQNQVEYAWYNMVKRLDIEDIQSRTPGEIAQQAIATGMDQQAVEMLTRAFQDIRYGGHPVSDGHRKRAREGMRKLGLGDST